jgi:hypothetical protein
MRSSSRLSGSRALKDRTAGRPNRPPRDSRASRPDPGTAEQHRHTSTPLVAPARKHPGPVDRVQPTPLVGRWACRSKDRRSQGYQVSLGEHGAARWISVFYRPGGGHEPSWQPHGAGADALAGGAAGGMDGVEPDYMRVDSRLIASYRARFCAKCLIKALAPPAMDLPTCPPRPREVWLWPQCQV